MVRQAHVRSLAPLLALTLALGCLSACGYFGGGAKSAARATPGAGQTPAQSRNADPLRADLVTAVSAAGDPGPIDLKFALQQRPVLGQPLTLTVRLTPNTDLNHIEARFHADEGLELRQGAQLPGLDHPQTGVPVDHTLVIVPAREGVYSVMATVTTESSTGAMSRSFAIPIIVGASAP